MYFDLPPDILQKCNEILGAEIRSVRYAGSGDISQARLLETAKGKFFLKMNTGDEAGRMFETEAKGLQLLEETGAVRIPAIIGFDQTPAGAFLLLEFVETGYRQPAFWEKFGAALAALHRRTDSRYGLDHDNFIGSLAQSNRRYDNWPDFYVNERLRPQLDLAGESGRLQTADFQNFEKLFQKIPTVCPAEPPALVHGDLWSGNFLADAESRPVLIDPSVAFAHREMDLAMSRLFGGFDRPFYRSYEEAFPLAPGFEERLPVYQLYYLLVHVNLFGSSYVGSVRSALRQFL